MDEKATPSADPTAPSSLAAARWRRQTSRAAIATWMVGLAKQVNREADVRGVVVVVLRDGPPQVATNRVEKVADLAEAARALGDAVQWCSPFTKTYEAKAMPPSKRTMAGWLAWRWYARLVEEARAEERLRSERTRRTWVCSHCGRGYAYRRAAEKHEAQCAHEHHQGRSA